MKRWQSLEIKSRASGCLVVDDVVCLQPSERKVEALLNLIEEDDETQVPDLSEINFNTPSSQKNDQVAVWVLQHPRNTLQGVHPRAVKDGAKT